MEKLSTLPTLGHLTEQISKVKWHRLISAHLAGSPQYPSTIYVLMKRFDDTLHLHVSICFKFPL